MISLCSSLRKSRLFLASGNAAWDDSLQTRLRIMWKKPEALAGEIYNWVYKSNKFVSIMFEPIILLYCTKACSNQSINSVFTIYELHSGDEYKDSGMIV